MKKLSLIILALIIGLALSTGLMAQTADQPSGSGTSEAPYLIASLNNLYWITASDAEVPSPAQATRWTASYNQTADIDASITSGWNSGAGWSPIGNSVTKFTGSYNGDGHIISGLYISRSATDYIGLFGYTNGSTIQNLGVTGVNITGQNYVGGLAGVNYDNATVSNSYSTGAVTGGMAVGGLVANNNSSIVNNSYSTCAVTGDSYVGGLVGYNDNSSILNSYSTGAVVGSSNFGGLVGANNSTVTNSFYDSETSGQSDDTGKGTPKTTDQMTTDALVYNYTTNIYLNAGWDFKGETINGTDDIWNIGNSRNDGYPYFDWQYSDDDASLPVELTAFTAESRSGGVLLKWCTESEIENLGFIIGKRKPENGDWTEIADYRSNPVLEGHGSTTEAHDYQFTDKAVQPGVTYEYRLGDVDYNGIVKWHKTVKITVEAESAKMPAEFGLQRAYPNPFNPTTTISYQLASASLVKISVYDVTGKLVETLVDEQKDRGSYSVVWDAGGLSSGIYIYKITAGEYNKVNKCLLIR